MARITCLIPPPADPFDEFPPIDVPAGWTDVLRTVLPGYRLYTNQGWAPTCTQAFDDAWDELVNAPNIQHLDYSAARINMGNVQGGLGWNYNMEMFHAHLSYDVQNYFTEETWQFIDNMKFDLSWSGSADLAPWKTTARLNGELKILDYGQPTVEWEPPELPIQFFLSTDSTFIEPPSFCPLAGISKLTFASGFHLLRLHNIAYKGQGGWTGPAPTLDGALINLAQEDGNPPIICPPTLIE